MRKFFKMVTLSKEYSNAGVTVRTVLSISPFVICSQNSKNISVSYTYSDYACEVVVVHEEIFVT